MKRSSLFFGILVLAFLGFFILPKISSAKSYYYENFNVDITINSDSTFDVKETQTFNFTGDFHYAYRGITLKDLDKISDLHCLDEDGRELNTDEYEIYTENNQRVIKWFFNEEDEIYQNTEMTWTVGYKVHGALKYFKDHDELYWNAVPEDRSVEIKNVNIQVHLPQAVEKNSVKQRLFIGPEGSKSEASSFEIIDNRTLGFWGRDIPSQNHFTIVVGWPKGIIKIPFSWYLRRMTIYLGIFLPILILTLMLRLWYKKGRDVKGRETIVPEYEPPKGLSPSLVGTLIDEKVDIKDITSCLIDLAVQGYIKIIEKEKKKFFGKEKTYTFQKLKSFDDLAEHEKKIAEGVFEGRDEIGTKDLTNKFYKKIPEIKKVLFERVTDLEFFTQNPQKAKKRFILLGTGIIVFGSLLLAFGPRIISSGTLGMGIAMSGVIIIIFAKFMPKKTKKGTLAREKCLGFKEYLHRAERFRLAECTPRTFEKFLPYAIVFGVEKAWANRFADIYHEAPDWYVAQGAYWGIGAISAGDIGKAAVFSATTLSQNLSSMVKDVSGVFSSSPSGGASGFGGGGAAGGGAGGGGGGAG